MPLINASLNQQSFLAAVASRLQHEDPHVAEAAQRSLFNLDIAGVTDELAGNPNLTLAVFTEMVNRRLPAKTACRLVDRPLPGTFVDVVVGAEHRDSVVARLLVTTPVTAPVAVELARRGRRSASVVCASRTYPADARLAALGQAALDARLLAAGDLGADLVADDVVADWLHDLSLWPAPQRAPRAELARLFWLRPSLLDRITATSAPAAVTVAAGSIALTDPQSRLRVRDAAVALGEKFALIAWIANPCTSYDETDGLLEVVPAAVRDDVMSARINRLRRPASVPSPATVEDPVVLDWLTRRAFYAENSTGKPVEICVLAANPAIDRERRVRQLETVRATHEVFAPEVDALLKRMAADSDAAWDMDGSPTAPCGHDVTDIVDIGPDKVVSYDEQRHELGTVKARSVGSYFAATFIDVATERLGSEANAWENLWALFPDFDGSLVELIDIAATL